MFAKNAGTNTLMSTTVEEKKRFVQIVLRINQKRNIKLAMSLK
jgi:hypothetical protein